MDAYGDSLTARQRSDIMRSQNRLSGVLEDNIVLSRKVNAHGDSLTARQRSDIMRSQNRLMEVLEENIDLLSIGPQATEDVHVDFCIKTQMSLLSARVVVIEKRTIGTDERVSGIEKQVHQLMNIMNKMVRQ